MSVWSDGKSSLLCFGAVVLMTGVAAAKPAYVASTVNLRAAPGTGSEIVAKIPGGSLVDASACDGGWCEIAWQDKRGFAIQTALDMSGRVPQQRAARLHRGLPTGRGRTWSKVRSITISRRSFITAARIIAPTTARIGAGGVTGGDGYFVWLPLPNASVSTMSVAK